VTTAARPALPLRLTLAVTGALLGALLSGCGGDGDGPDRQDGQVEAGHTHAPGQGHTSLAVGDGTRASEVGYSLTGVRVRERDGGIGELRFRIEDHRGEPVTEFVEELTKELHLYVVSDDLTVFRHLHPARGDDGTWRAPFDVPDAGAYRVVTEFIAVDEGGNGDHVVLGTELPRPAGDPGDTAAEDRAVTVAVSQAPVAGRDGELRLVVRDAAGSPVELGTYLGAYSHVTGFHRESGAMVHLHPLAAPDVTEDGSELTFHAEIPDPGDYRLFAQVRVDGFLHTVPVELTVARSA